MSLLHFLIACCNVYEEENAREVVAYLLSQGIDAEAKNEQEQSPLIAAAHRGLMKIVTLLERHIMSVLNEERRRRAIAERGSYARVARL